MFSLALNPGVALPL